MTEYLDVFDCFMEKTGTEERKIVHSKGLWHQTFHCWIIKKVKNKIYVIFQKRSEKKSDSPNMLDITAAGHLEVGETKEDGIREVKEELGINVPYGNLKYLGIRIEVIDVPYFKNNEFQHVYLLEDNRNLEEYTLQESEVAGLVAIELNEGLKLLDGECSVLQCESVFLENGKKVKKVINVRLEDIIPRLDNYYKKVFIMAERYFSNCKYLSI